MREEVSKYDRTTTEHDTMLKRLWESVQILAVALDPADLRDWDSPTLHACLKAQPSNFPFALLQRSIQRFCSDFKTEDNHGNLPLHIVAGRSAEDDPNDNFLTEIANHFPQAASITNHDVKLPLQLAIGSGLRSFDTGIADLLEVFPAPDHFSMPVFTLILGLAATRNRATVQPCSSRCCDINRSFFHIVISEYYIHTHTQKLWDKSQYYKIILLQ